MPEPTQTETVEKPILEQLQDKRSELLTAASVAVQDRQKIRGEFEARTKDDKTLTDEQRTEREKELTQHNLDEGAFDSGHQQRMAEIKEIDKRIDEEELLARRAADAKRASRNQVSVTHESLTYERENGHSYFRDLAVKANANGFAAQVEDPGAAVERLSKHADEMRVEMPKIEAERERRACNDVDQAERSFTGSFIQGVRKRGLEDNPFMEKRVNPNRLDGQGGFFVPPLWLPEFIAYLRAGRVAADLARRMPLPTGTDSINMPKILTPTEVAPQQADSAPVASKDWTDTAVTANVKTLAGQSDVAIQLLEQSPYHLDQVIMEDLIADYNRKIDREVLTAPGTNTASLNAGLIKGIYPVTNWESSNSVTWTEGAPLATAYNMVRGAMASRIATNRFSVQDLHYVEHPRRWYWYSTALDGAEGKSGRPLVNSADFGPFNVSALVTGGEEPAEGLVGRVPYGPHGIYIDANVPILDKEGTPGAGTADVGIAAKWDDLWLFEGALRTRVLNEVLSGTLEIRFQVFNYYAFLVRYGQSIAIATGTGFAPPTGALGAGSITF